MVSNLGLIYTVWLPDFIIIQFDLRQAMSDPTDRYDPCVVKSLLLVCGILGFLAWDRHVHADSAVNPPIINTSPIPIQPDPPPAFTFNYSWDVKQNPGVFRYDPVLPQTDLQTWTGTPNVVVKTSHFTHVSEQSAGAVGSDAPSLPPVIVPANPPTLVYDLSSDGVVTQKSGDAAP
ncbi:MAG: hypothetical protein H7839_00290 [Magnetococcus sp. YQC-5]